MRAGAPFLTRLDVDHALVGRIWDARAKAYITEDALYARLFSTDAVLLGEKHDNPDHHRLQAHVLEQLVAKGKRPAVLFEMLDVNQQADVGAFVAAHPSDPDAFGPALGWEARRWPSFAMYQPIVKAALAAKLPIVAANYPADAARKLAREGLPALSPDEVRRLDLDHPLPDALEASLRTELTESHCGQLPDRYLGPMALAQHARDSQMTERILPYVPERGAVVIAGAGHVRRDRGIPYYLREKRPASSIASVAWIEVEHGANEPAEYAAHFGAGELPFDYVWFTPRLNDDDPCAGFHAR
jgi:uncharacterized iron-regulated protein